MDAQTLFALRQPAGQAALAAAQALIPREADFLRHFQTLQRQFPPILARAALETAILRREAQEKFPAASQMYFTREALEQASGAAIAQRRASRYQGALRILDLGCSIGGDTLALAEVAPTIGIDLDRLRLAMAQANAAACSGLAEADVLQQVDFVQANLEAALPAQVDSKTGLFFDPARRAQGRRLHSVHAYQPPLTAIDRWLEQTPMLGVKVSPGVNMDEIRSYTTRCEVEFVSSGGELKEATLWFGPLQSAARRATLLPSGETLAVDETFPDWAARSAPRAPLSPPRAYLYEPDAAVIRAGLVEELAARLNAAQLDADIAYLTADVPVETPFARRWQVLEWLPFQLKNLRAVLRGRNIGRVTVKKRGSPIRPEDLVRQLRLDGEKEAVIFLTHIDGKPAAILAEPATA